LVDGGRCSLPLTRRAFSPQLVACLGFPCIACCPIDDRCARAPLATAADNCSALGVRGAGACSPAAAQACSRDARPLAGAHKRAGAGAMRHAVAAADAAAASCTRSIVTVGAAMMAPAAAAPVITVVNSGGGGNGGGGTTNELALAQAAASERAEVRTRGQLCRIAHVMRSAQAADALARARLPPAAPGPPGPPGGAQSRGRAVHRMEPLCESMR
jgi:hypothetical protein